MWKQNKTNSKLLYHILFQLYPWNSTKSLGSCSNMIWNNKKHSFISKPILTIIFHRSAHLMLSKLQKAWAEGNFFPVFWDKNRETPIPQYSHPQLLSHTGFWISPQSQKGRKCSLWRKEQEAGRMGTAEQVPLLAKMLCLPDGGRRELITFLWEELHSQIFARCFKSPALCSCPALFYSLLFSTEAPFSGQIDCLEFGRKCSHRGQDWQTLLGV